MHIIVFEWDKNKNLSNIKKHKVSFEEAMSIFYDDNAKLIADPHHSPDEERFLLLGISSKLRLLVVCHSYRKNDNAIRIISARKDTKYEQSF